MDYFRKATATSPTIIMDAKARSALISGVSTCRNIDSYRQVTDRVKDQLRRFDYNYINIKLDTFNIHAAKSLIELLKAAINDKGTETKRIHWIAGDDTEMREMALDYCDLLELELELTDSSVLMAAS